MVKEAKNLKPKAERPKDSSEKRACPLHSFLPAVYFANHCQKQEKNEDVKAVFGSQQRERAGFFRNVTIGPSGGHLSPFSFPHT